jgi:hypothetical protein
MSDGSLGERGVVEDESRAASHIEIRLSEDGPVLISGNVTILGAQDEDVRSGTKTALCRCGQSGNKPFCDGTHRSVGFKSD